MVTVPHSYRSRNARIGANPQIVSAILLAALAVVVASLLTARGASNATHSRLPVVSASADFSQMPLAFIPNAGQTDPQVRYEAQAMGGALFFTLNEVVLSLPVSENTAVVRMQFEGAAAQPDLRAGTQLPGVVNFIEGNQPAQWHTNLPTYNSLTYGQLYNGINLHYDGVDGRLKSTYLIAANANPAQIRWHYTGTTNATVDAISGDLHLVLPNTQTPLIERAPIAWQEQNGQRIAVPVRYDLQPDGSIGFALGAYNPALPLTIDPTLEYSTFIGGSGADRINAIAIDPTSGDMFVTGETSSTPFPGSPTSFGVTGAGSFPNVFVARFKADGTGTLYRTIIGGTNTDKGLSIAVTSGGIANVAGFSFSSDFPTTSGAVSPTYNNNGDMIAFALNADGTQAYSTYLGGASTDTGYSIAASGNFLYIAGSTDGVVPGQSSAPAGGTDAIVYKIDKTISGVGGQIYARRLGGLFTDMARAIALDTGGNVYVTGSTLSDNTTFATTTPYQPNNAGGSDAFITQLDTTGATTYNSFLGGTDTDEGLGIAVDPAGDVVYLTGRTLSSSFPDASGSSVGQDAFVTKINIATNAVAYSRYLGSPGVDVGNAIAIDTTGAAYVVGSTSSSNFYSQNPLPEMASNGGNVDGFITRFDPSGNPSYSSRIGGTSDDVATGVATFQASQGTKVYVSGYTNSSNFPMTTPPTTIQSTIGGSEDGFLVRIANTRPQVDLNDGTTSNGIDFGPVTWTEAGGTVVGSGAVAIGNSTGLTVLDSDSATLAYAEVRFVASTGTGGSAIVPTDGASESLNVTLSGGITGSFNPATGILRLTNGGSATLSNFQNVLRSITYNNSSENPTAGPRLLAVEVSDGIDSNTPFAFSTMTVVATNDPPVVTVPGPVTGSEDTAIPVSVVSVADVDAGTSTIQVTVSVPVAAGTVTATASGATVTPASGASIVISGSRTNVNATLASLSFTGVTDFNTAVGSPITLTVLASDLGNTPSPALTDQKTVSITVTPVNDAPVVGSSPVTVTTTEDTAKTISIVSDLGVNDSKDTTSPPAAAGATAFLPVQSIVIVGAGTTNGTLTNNTTAGTFLYTPNANFSGSDSFTYHVCDQGTGLPTNACSTDQVVNITITAVNDAPIVTVPGSGFTGNEEAAISVTGVSVADVDAGGNDIKVTVSVPVAAGTVTAAASGAATVTPASGAGIDIVGTIADVNLTLATLSFTGVTDFNTAVGSPLTLTVLADDQGNTPSPAKTDQKTVSITVSPVNDAPVVGSNPVSVTTAEDTAKTISIVTDLGVNDSKDTTAPAAAGGATFPAVASITIVGAGTTNGTLTNNTTAGTFLYTPNANFSGPDSFVYHVCDNGTPGSACSTDQTVNITITPVNDPPVVTLSAPALSYTENAAAISINSLPPTVNDVDSTDYNGGSLTASITSLGDTGDTITLVDGGNITVLGTAVSYSGSPIATMSGGTIGTALTINFTSATVTPAVVEELIQQLQYSNTRDSFAPGITTAKVVTIRVNDGGSVPNTGSATRSLQVLGVNDAPVLDNTGTMVLNSIPENPTVNNGTLVSAILASAGGTRISDLDSGALQGIAVIGADTTNGAWQFSINSGASWTAFGSLSPTSATLLAPSNRIRFVPNTFFNGNVNPGITFVAWDQTSIATNGATGIDSTPGGGTSAFSTSTETASISVTGVNQAPLLDNTGTMILTPIAEDVLVASNPGTLVSTILASAGGTRITDSDTAALQGIAIIGIDATNGTWQFSINGGTNWTQISAPSNGTAVLLASDSQTLVRFLPNPNYNGTLDPGITFRAWDQTSSANGATLVDVSVNGDPSAFSTATEIASIVVTPVNDLPNAQDDTAAIARNSQTTINVLANDSSLPDTGETLTIIAVSFAAHGVVTIAPGSTAVLYTPAFDYTGLDSFTYTISDGNGGTANATVHVQVGQFYVSLPLVLGEPIKPDLEITNFTITPAGPNYLFSDKVTISVTVRNTGTLPTGGFYTELYMNPSVVPTKAGILWNTVCSIQPCYGITWYVQSGLASGQSITLTSTPGSYYSGNWQGSFAPGTTDVYVYTDSWNGTEPDGFIKERDETNNMAVVHGLHVAGFGTTTQSPSLTVPEQALTTDRNIHRDQPLR